ncbi:MAG: nitroreductase family protein [Nanoarchaeota archaeon]|nr:nitroreductase family protein [Nanoarchaeota archaeon]
MDMFEAMEKRYSCRNYLKRRVSEEDLALILDAGAKAPNAGNLQNWIFIIARDENKKEQLTKASLNQRWMMGSDLFIIICSDSEPSKRFYSEKGKTYDMQNCAAAAENMLLMAAAIGLGACWVGSFNQEAVSRILKLPGNITPQAVITLGYPAEKYKKEKRSSLDAFTHFEEYGNKISDQTLAKKLSSDLKTLYQRIPRERKK